jgi:hypothetical protein
MTLQIYCRQYALCLFPQACRQFSSLASAPKAEEAAGLAGEGLKKITVQKYSGRKAEVHFL